MKGLENDEMIRVRAQRIQSKAFQNKETELYDILKLMKLLNFR